MMIVIPVIDIHDNLYQYILEERRITRINIMIIRNTTDADKPVSITDQLMDIGGNTN